MRRLICFIVILTIPGITPLAAKTEQKPAWDQAEQIYDMEQMEEARQALQREHGSQQVFYLELERFETRLGGKQNELSWSGTVSWGGDLNKLWFKSEGVAPIDDTGEEHAELQILYSRAVSPFWDVQAGLGFGFGSTNYTDFVLSAHGLAPYWVEVDAAVFMGAGGDLRLKLEAEYELRLTQRLILQPRIETLMANRTSRKRETYSGLNDVHAGLRLRYELRREFAPYIGVEWKENFSAKKDTLSANGEKSREGVFLIGIRGWY